MSGLVYDGKVGALRLPTLRATTTLFVVVGQISEAHPP
ncbi:hypothetical protein BN129_2182 [Cronobacter sakazakii 701]|nr:hypothetical protein BN129_2182 [Cronobacter sakazakii 701]